ncbi:MAG: DUF2935 domain-containing protein [Clostridia bacterium]
MLDIKNDLLFWTGIMRDHAMFQINALAPKEIQFIQHASYYRDFFQRVHDEVGKADNWRPLLPNLMQGLSCFIEFKKMILRGLLTCGLQINLPPSNINHQINEAMEFQSLLLMPLQQCMVKNMNLAGYIKVWMADSIVHAASLISFLDASEGILVDEATKYKMIFDKLFTKASELEMMLNKTGFNDGALGFLAEEAIEHLDKFNCYLEKLRDLRSKCKVLAIGTLLPLIPDHFIREQRYFIAKIRCCL